MSRVPWHILFGLLIGIGWVVALGAHARSTGDLDASPPHAALDAAHCEATLPAEERTHTAPRLAGDLVLGLLLLGARLLVLRWRIAVATRALLGAPADEVRARIARLGGGDVAASDAAEHRRVGSLMHWLDAAEARWVALAQARHQAEERLWVSASGYRLLADMASDIVWTMALDGQVTSVSPSVEQLLGFTQAEVMRQSLEEIHTPASVAIMLAYFTRSRACLDAGLPLEGRAMSSNIAARTARPSGLMSPCYPCMTPTARRWTCSGCRVTSPR